MFDAIEYSGFVIPGLNFNRRAIRLSQRSRKPLLGFGDVHHLWQLGRTYTYVYAEAEITSILDAIRNSSDVDHHRYLAGFQVIPTEVPGIGEFDFAQVKVSMRVSDEMGEGIRSGDVLGLDVLLPQATARVGGFSDACHSLTAATTVPTGSEERLIDEMEEILGST